MKKTVLAIAVFSLLIFNSQAQKDLSYYTRQIDSIAPIYAVPRDIYVEKLGFSFENSVLSTNDKDQLIKKIEKLYTQETYINLYSLASVMLRDMFYNKSEKAIRQKITEISLEYYFYPRTSKFESRDVSDYSPKAKKLLHEVLQKYNNKKKDKQLFSLYMIRAKEQYASNDHIRDDLRKQLKKTISDSTCMDQAIDSILFNNYIQPYAEKDFETARVGSNLILVTGDLGLKECIPELKKMFIACSDSLDCYDVRAICYALVRMGDREAEDFLINRDFLDYEKWPDLRYLRSERILWAYLAHNRKNNETTTMFSNSQTRYPICSLMIKEVSPFIKNLPSELKESNRVYPEDARNGEKFSKEFSKNLDEIYEWLIANRDTVEFDFGE